MTSEVVVMNRMGIALAADSVATIYADGVQKKRHDSVAKLFMMSDRHPVGIMTYNDASLLGVPWETIIKLFRRQLGKSSFPTLGEYGQKLVEFLMQKQNFFPVDVERKYFERQFETECYRIRNDAKLLYEFVPLSERMDVDSAAKKRSAVVAEVISERLARWQNQDDAAGFTEKLAEDFLGSMSGDVSRIIRKVLSKWFVDSSGVIQLNDISRHLIFKRDLDMEVYTGLVIGGFGEQEHFPVVQHIFVYGVYGGILKYEQSQVQRISEEEPSYIESFAETEAVNDFLFGVSDKVLDEIDRAVEIVRTSPGEVLRQVTGMRKDKKAALIAETEIASEKSAKNIEDNIELLLSRRYGGILDVVEILPLKELAQVASTFVRLSSFEKQLSLEAETVGEPIDVAVISKGDGFIWINRKHYFQAGLNHRYFRDYPQNEPPREEPDGKAEN
ncbi:MAG: hypothetical protein OXF79_27865 [Chloroflexi bacterium]|nr:hypothetical protein [Chloroflexota bacterium]